MSSNFVMKNICFQQIEDLDYDVFMAPMFTDNRDNASGKLVLLPHVYSEGKISHEYTVDDMMKALEMMDIFAVGPYVKWTGNHDASTRIVFFSAHYSLCDCADYEKYVSYIKPGQEDEKDNLCSEKLGDANLWHVNGNNQGCCTFNNVPLAMQREVAARFMQMSVEEAHKRIALVTHMKFFE